ncbi:MAG: hypothetical protein PHH82_01985 [Candidatus ainarchaeum sp.]|nr:hypothetical protein [Candidatus ainarchaeum sp.]
MDNGKKKIFYKALAFTFAVMFFALLFANLVYDWKKTDLNDDILDIYNKSTDLKITMNFYDTMVDANSCDLMENQLIGLSDFLYDLGKKVNLAADDKDNLEEVKKLQKEYVYNNLDLWLRLKKFNSICPQYVKNYILYFYPYNCNECAPLETAIQDIKDKYGDKVWIFSIPSEVGISAVDNILEFYDVNYIPGIVINEKTIYEQDILDGMNKFLYDYNALEE